MTTSIARAAALSGLLVAAPVLADEGMWTFDNPPAKQLKEKYGFELTKEWLDKVSLASVRFMDGGSGSFVSPDGLMITNHHVGLGCIQNVSSAEKDYVKTGFYAPSWGEEAACPGYARPVIPRDVDGTGPEGLRHPGGPLVARLERRSSGAQAMNTNRPPSCAVGRQPVRPPLDQIPGGGDRDDDARTRLIGLG